MKKKPCSPIIKKKKIRFVVYFLKTRSNLSYYRSFSFLSLSFPITTKRNTNGVVCEIPPSSRRLMAIYGMPTGAGSLAPPRQGVVCETPPSSRRLMPIYGIIGHGLAHGLTHAHTPSRHSEGYKCYRILKIRGH